MAAEPLIERDYLGREAPVSLSAQPSLPAGGAPAGVSSGPETSASGVTGGAGQASIPGVSVAPEGSMATLELPGGGTLGDLFKALSAAGQTGRFANFAEQVFGSEATGSFARDPAIEEAWQAFREGERADLSSFPSFLGGFGDPTVLSQVSGGELALGAEGAGAAAPSLAGTAGLEAGVMGFGQVAPIWAGLTSLVDFLGEGTLPFEGILNQIFGFNNPSEEWQSFGGRLGETLGATEKANQGLASALATADSPQAIEAALSAWRGVTGAPGGPMEIGDLPGATGRRHEWGITADFSPEVFGLREMLQSAMAGAPPEQRIEALMRAMQSRRDVLAAEKAAVQAEQERIYGDAPYQFMMTTGSA